jgi:hypothetical protein
MMKTLSLFLLTLVCSARCSGENAAPYSLLQRGDKVSLIHNATKRVVWTEKAGSSEAIWSRDRRAVAMESGGGFLLWREGAGRTLIQNPAIPGSGGKDHYDYSMGGVWSPNKRRFLARYGISAMSDIGPNGAGRLFCFRLGRGDSYRASVLPSPDFVDRMKWRDNRTVLYWTVDNIAMRPATKARIWRVP